ncbi:3-hydroxyisobutyrate dehydrogenase-like beta-hydroxyacid dehydrogenase [Bradyrhizobium sp. i1.4.4]
MADASKTNPQGVERLGYLGLGLMGTPMTRRLLKAGHQVAVWNRSEGKVAPLVAAGAKRAATPRDMLANADIVFMCVTDAAAVEEVIFGPDGLAAAPGAGRLVVDFSSIHPDAARDLATRLKDANGAGWIDAPVSGGTKGAEEGTLAIMAGGGEKLLTSSGHGPMCCTWHAGSPTWARSGLAKPQNSATR